MKRLLVLDLDGTLIDSLSVLETNCSEYGEGTTEYSFCLVHQFYSNQENVLKASPKSDVIEKALEFVTSGKSDVIVLTSRSTFPAKKTIEMVQRLFGDFDISDKVFIASGGGGKSLTLAAIIYEHEYTDVVVVDDIVKNFEDLNSYLLVMKSVVQKDIPHVIRVLSPDVFVKTTLWGDS